MQVKEFVIKYVKPEYRVKFWDLMRKHDGRNDVYLAFYDDDLLFTKLKEAKE